MPELNLKTQTKLADLAGVHRSSVTRALQSDPPKLKLYNGTKKIWVDDPLTQAWLNDINPNRLNKLHSSLVVPEVIDPANKPKSFVPDVTPEIQNFAEKYAKERALKEEQVRIEKEMNNSVRRGDLLEQSAVNTSLMMLIDQVFNNIDRYAANHYDEMQRKVLALGKESTELKREFQNDIMKMKHEAKEEVCKKMEEIAEEQARS